MTATRRPVTHRTDQARTGPWSRLLLVVGSLLAVIGAVLIPLPGPGVALLALAVPVLGAGAVLTALGRRSPDGG